jgi:hypothetical protein
MKEIIAIDGDETLWKFKKSWEAYYLNVLGKSGHVDWNDPEMCKLGHAFINSRHHDHIEAMEGAIEALRNIAVKRIPVIITFRDEVLRMPTVRLAEKLYPKVFKGVHFIHNEGRNILGTKADVCLKIGAREIVDDAVHVVTQARAAGIRSFLFHTEDNAHVDAPGIIRIRSWHEFPDHIL